MSASPSEWFEPREIINLVHHEAERVGCSIQVDLQREEGFESIHLGSPDGRGFRLEIGIEPGMIYLTTESGPRGEWPLRSDSDVVNTLDDLRIIVRAVLLGEVVAERRQMVGGGFRTSVSFGDRRRLSGGSGLRPTIPWRHHADRFEPYPTESS
jgi:hypothetical protein